METWTYLYLSGMHSSKAGAYHLPGCPGFPTLSRLPSLTYLPPKIQAISLSRTGHLFSGAEACCAAGRRLRPDTFPPSFPHSGPLACHVLPLWLYEEERRAPASLRHAHYKGFWAGPCISLKSLLFLSTSAAYTYIHSHEIYVSLEKDFLWNKFKFRASHACLPCGSWHGTSRRLISIFGPYHYSSHCLQHLQAGTCSPPSETEQKHTHTPAPFAWEGRTYQCLQQHPFLWEAWEEDIPFLWCGDRGLIHCLAPHIVAQACAMASFTPFTFSSPLVKLNKDGGMARKGRMPAPFHHSMLLAGPGSGGGPGGGPDWNFSCLLLLLRHCPCLFLHGMTTTWLFSHAWHALCQPCSHVLLCGLV